MSINPLLLSLFLSVLSNITAEAQEMLYLSSGNTITVQNIDAETGALTVIQTLRLSGLSVFTFSPDKQFLYAIASSDSNAKGTTKQFAIVTFSVAIDGRLTQLNSAPISARTTELNTDNSGQYIAGASYGKGYVSIWKLQQGVFTGQLIEQLPLAKKVHAVRFSEDNQMLYVPATGPNKIFQLAFDQSTGKLSPISPALSANKGARQPRHLVLHPHLNIAYTTQERIKPGVAVWQQDPVTNQLSLVQTLTNSDDTSARITNADLHLSRDAKFLYISSRDQAGVQDHIALYKVSDSDGQLSFIKRFATEHFPRSFTLSDHGDFVFVAGQKNATLGVYRVNKSTGHLTRLQQYKTGHNPIWLETHSLPLSTR
ncbi:lactonase family protein [Thalassotalea sp. HSM 43]|uniref:lactonase family protein n=1 Tax=Thalassotalea sp. HSM 43 TaxID=2552945 RepID=UPI0016790506|nr:beta-propeller fold lactonase family protein [Thalassotalea sp. HSM 43]